MSTRFMLKHKIIMILVEGSIDKGVGLRVCACARVLVCIFVHITLTRLIHFKFIIYSHQISPQHDAILPVIFYECEH